MATAPQPNKANNTHQPSWQEADRLDALHEYKILDTEAEAEFDNIVKLAAQICKAPVSLISLVDKDRQWFKAETGLGVRETSLDESVCKFAIREGDIYVVPDATKDERLKDNPLVTNDPNFRFYAGAVMYTPDGYPIGTLCILDYKPRELTTEEEFNLKTLAKLAMSQIELRHLLKEKQAGEKNFHEMADSINQMIWVSDPEGEFEYYNKRWYEYTGLPENSMDGPEWDIIIPYEEEQPVIAIWKECLKTGEPFEGKYPLRRADGVYRWILSRAECVRDSTGKITRWYGTCTDIQDLIDAQQKAEEANIAKSEFLANMSHEIRTPMNAVIGIANILAKSSPLTQKQMDFIKTLQVSADTLLALINDLLDISKIEARTIELEEVTFSINDVVDEVMEIMQVRAKEKNLQFNKKINSTFVEKNNFIGDPARIRQIIMNLCSNALKFTEQGGVTVLLSSVATRDPAKYEIKVTVQDTGIGIPQDKLNTIFDKFVQADTSINRRYGGTGLGLSITKTLAETMGGNIKVESKIGTGSSFTVTLPLKLDPVSTQTEKQIEMSEEAISTKEKSKILLVEDYAANVLVAKTYLEQFGYECEVADNGFDAIERFKQGNIDLILMDLQMPGMSGLDATKNIRHYEDLNKLPPISIIGMTAHAMSGDRERCLEAGMNEYVSKPFNPNALEALLADFLNNRR